MKKTLIVVAHPNLENSVYNSHLLDMAKDIESVDIHILPKDTNNLNIPNEQQKLLPYDNIVFQFPLFWYNMPHNLKQYLDGILSFGFAYGANGEAELKGKTISVITTVGSPTHAYKEDGSNKYSANDFLKSFEVTSDFVQATFKGCIPIYGCSPWGESTMEEFKESAKQFTAHLQKLQN